MATQLGRNTPCPCGSGKKYKQCCLPKQQKLQTNSAQQDQALRQALQIAHAHHQHGNVSASEKLCHQIIHSQPTQPDAWHLLGIIALQQGNIEVAIAQLQRALKSRPHHPEYLGNLAFSHHEKGDIEEAQRLYIHALKIAPEYENALYNQHALLLDSKHLPRAIANLEKLLKKHPTDMDTLYMLGVLSEYADDNQRAENYLSTLRTGSALAKARLDAWLHLKSASGSLPPITGSMISTFKLALNAAPQDGMVLEFGVRFGNTIRQIASLVKTEIHGFDSFEGLPEVWHHEPKGSYTTKGEIPKVPTHVKLHIGWFKDTLPKFLDQQKGPVRFVNVDCDIYSSTKTVLDLLAPRMVPGSVIVFDEYIGNEHWREDEFKAFQEAVVMYGWNYEYLCFSAFTKQVAVRITRI